MADDENPTCECEREDDARFIIQAVNNYQPLLDLARTVNNFPPHMSYLEMEIFIEELGNMAAKVLKGIE